MPNLILRFRVSVAPYVGAWIETVILIYLTATSLSHPTWVRGLKPSFRPPSLPCQPSHPTWVRGLKLTADDDGVAHHLTSHPTWVRGLKRYMYVARAASPVSHPTWVRGLKRVLYLEPYN